MRLLKFTYAKPFCLPGSDYIPSNIKPLCAKEQFEEIVIYGVVGDDYFEDENKKTKEVLFVGTGNDNLPLNDYDYIDTVMYNGGRWVIHVFIEKGDK